MIEFLVIVALAGYIYYLRNYADLRTAAEKEMGAIANGIALFDEGRLEEAFTYFDQRTKTNPKSAAAYLYRAKCYLKWGKSSEAKADLQKSLSFDDTLYQIHLESGKFQYAAGNFSEALRSLEKAVFKSEGIIPETYHWRGMTHRELGHEPEARQDFETEKQLLLQAESGEKNISQKQAILIDRRLLANCLLTFFTSALLLWMIKHAESIHLPYLLAVFAAGSLGFAEPHKGWILALLQGTILWTAYTFFTAIPDNSGQRELENFSLYGCIILTFAGSFLGAFLKRALAS